MPNVPVTWLSSKYFFKLLSTETLLGEQAAQYSNSTAADIFTKTFIQKKFRQSYTNAGWKEKLPGRICLN
jgi:hypothetical protein